MRSMIRIFTAGVIAILFFLTGCCERQYSTENKTAEYQFVVASDPQLFWGTIENWQQTIQEINRISPDFVVVCGDMMNTGDEKEIEAYWEQAHKLSTGIALYHVAGNHDVGNEPAPESIKLYEDHFGKTCYSFEHKNSLFIVLESASLRQTSEKHAPLVSEQMKWLKQTLSDADKKDYANKFVFLHHPLILNDLNEAEEYFNFPVPLRHELIELFVAHNIKMVFSGHLHRDKTVKLADLEMVITGSCGKALGDSALGFRVVNVSGEKVNHAYYELPDQSMR